MKSHHIAPRRLKVQKLMNVRHVGPGDSARRPSKGVVRADVAFGRVFVHCLGHQAFADHNYAYRPAMIMNWCSLPGAPAEHQQLGVLASSYQIPRVLARGENAVARVIVLPEAQL